MGLDHDGIFKQLLSAFLVEFLDLFAPELLALLDPTDLSLLPTESFVNLLDPDRRTADLLVQARIRGSPGAILIHLEHQAQADDLLDRRMFHYFARFYDHYDQLIYPIAFCSYPSPRRAAAQRHQIAIGTRRILSFEYQVVQLNQLVWHTYLGHPNPLATALMARMRMAPGERWQVKAACLQQLLGCALSTSQRRMLASFVSIYLPLNAEENERFTAAVAAWQPETKEAVVELISEWEQKGIEKGIAIGIEKGIEEGVEKGVNQGQQVLLIRRLTRRYGPLPETVPSAIMRLSSADLLALDDALWDFTTLEEVQRWLAQQ
jgi:hypothetical protein